MTRDKTVKELRLEALGQKRDDLILKIIDNLYKGKINNLFWSKNGFMIGEEFMAGVTISRHSNTRTYYHRPNSIKDNLMKNIHSIAKVFNEKCPEHLNILEFLIDKIDEGWTSKTEDEIEEDIQKIKERCGSILMILSIEAGN